MFELFKITIASVFANVYFAFVVPIVTGLFFMLVWNSILSDMVNMEHITYIQAWGIMFCLQLFRYNPMRGE